ncbi:MAG: sugar transferase [Actinobacteria bacterium]|nr:sugar transferase [Actinomycetota bacterium]
MASLVLVVASPVMAVLAIAVRLDSAGPVIYRARRIARGGDTFTLFKFRSMRVDQAGPGITVRGDDRVTRIGAFMRRTKLDELPQMWNVLKGEMSIVGPRPEDPAYAEWYPDDLRAIFRFRPGITSPASVTFRNEEERLAELAAGGASLEEAYKVVLAEKIPIDLAYFPTRSNMSDLRWIGRTAVAMVQSR